jgi:AcrR family transcriptional regulator
MMQRIQTSPRKTPRQKRARDTVAALLKATAQVLVREGYDRASTNRIAQVAGVSIGSLYQYFPSKEALVGELIDRHVEGQLALFQEKLAEVGNPSLRTASREIIKAMLEVHRVDPKLHKVVAEQVPRLGRLNQLFEFSRRIEEILRIYLESRRDEILPKNLEHAAFVLVHAVEAITHAAVIDRPQYIDDNRLIDEVTDLVIRYLCGDE